MKSKEQQMLEEAYRKVDESVLDTVRAWNYKRLANRSFDKATGALDKAQEHDFADPERFKHEDEFSKHMSASREREKRAKELSRPTPPGIDPALAKQYWAAFEKVQDGDISPKQWGDICAMMLAKVMGADKESSVKESVTKDNQEEILVDNGKQSIEELTKEIDKLKKSLDTAEDWRKVQLNKIIKAKMAKRAELIGNK